VLCSTRNKSAITLQHSQTTPERESGRGHWPQMQRVSLMHAPIAVRQSSVSFHRRLSVAFVGFGVVATIAWNTFLGYVAVMLLRRYL